MADEQQIPSTSGAAIGEHPDHLDNSRAPAPRRSIVRRYPVGVAVGAGVAGLVMGGILTAAILPALMFGPPIAGPFGAPPPPPAVAVPPWGAPPPPPAWGPPPPGWGPQSPGWGPPPGRAVMPPAPGQLPTPPGATTAPPPGAAQPGGPPPVSGPQR